MYKNQTIRVSYQNGENVISVTWNDCWRQIGWFDFPKIHADFHAKQFSAAQKKSIRVERPDWFKEDLNHNSSHLR